MSAKNILLIGLFVAAAGCSNNSSIKKPPETYFSEGQKLYAKGKNEAAIEKWKQVKESFSSPILSTAAELMIADAQFDDKNYIEAAASYEGFRKLHPNSEKADYALYKQGLSHYNQISKIDTDQTPLKNSIADFELFAKEYPKSEYIGKVREKLESCRVMQCEYEIYVGRFYYRTEKYTSAISRLNEALEKFPASPVNDEALYYLGQAYLETGNKAKAKEALQRLIKDFKTSKHAAEARKLLDKTA
jgi:outer membrane protein assembly factor BamD